jgi:dTMP kinase
MSTQRKGKLIVIEGTDGSGKKTQTAKLLERLLAQGAEFASGATGLFAPHANLKAEELKGIDEDKDPSTQDVKDLVHTQQSEKDSIDSIAKNFVETIDFPRYGTPSCYLVEKYLHGGFGTALEVGPYIASMFYAVDRYDHSADMKKKLDAGTVLVSDRYVSASMGHQAGKIDDLVERDKYLEWLNNLEFEIFKIPRPDLTIFLYVDSETNQRLMASRPDKEYLKGKKTDIHEADIEHLRKASEAFVYVAKKFGWTVIDCAPKTTEHPEGKLLSIDEIHEKVWKEVSGVLNK